MASNRVIFFTTLIPVGFAAYLAAEAWRIKPGFSLYSWAYFFFYTSATGLSAIALTRFLATVWPLYIVCGKMASDFFPDPGGWDPYVGLAMLYAFGVLMFLQITSFSVTL